MKIKVHKTEDGYCVYRQCGQKWKYWLPEWQRDIRGDDYREFYKSVEAAKKAAIKASEQLRSNDVIFDI